MTGERETTTVNIMEEQEHISWGGVLLTLPEYIWNVLVLSGSETASIPSSKAKAAQELQAKTLHDLNPSLPALQRAKATQNQVMLRAEKAIQTPRVERKRAGRSWCNSVLLLLAIGLALSLIPEIYGDFRRKMDQQATELKLKSANCAKDYSLNQCDPATRIPIAEAFCQEKEACMQLAEVFALSTMARVLGETVESFVAAMSWRTLLFLGCVGVMVLKIGLRATAR